MGATEQALPNGRDLVYRGGVVTWDEMMASTEKWEARLKLQG